MRAWRSLAVVLAGFVSGAVTVASASPGDGECK